MADKMIRTAGRGADGTAKALSTDDVGRLQINDSQTQIDKYSSNVAIPASERFYSKVFSLYGNYTIYFSFATANLSGWTFNLVEGYGASETITQLQVSQIAPSDNSPVSGRFLFKATGINRVGDFRLLAINGSAFSRTINDIKVVSAPDTVRPDEFTLRPVTVAANSQNDVISPSAFSNLSPGTYELYFTVNSFNLNHIAITYQDGLATFGQTTALQIERKSDTGNLYAERVYKATIPLISSVFKLTFINNSSSEFVYSNIVLKKVTSQLPMVKVKRVSRIITSHSFPPGESIMEIRPDKGHIAKLTLFNLLLAAGTNSGENFSIRVGVGSTIFGSIQFGIRHPNGIGNQLFILNGILERGTLWEFIDTTQDAINRFFETAVFSHETPLLIRFNNSSASAVTPGGFSTIVANFVQERVMDYSSDGAGIVDV